ncbi:MAG: polysaccharide deacetylase family protein [Bacilli bacterium]
MKRFSDAVVLCVLLCCVAFICVRDSVATPYIPNRIPIYTSEGWYAPTRLQQWNGARIKEVYLTFDDGPNEHTSKILDMLHTYGIHATFFVVGGSVKQYPRTIERMIREGHYIGLHSMTHDYGQLYRECHLVGEMREESNLLANAFHLTPTLIRTPYGTVPTVSPKIHNELRASAYHVWDWTIDSLDWKYPNNLTTIVNNVRNNATEQFEVVLMHDTAQTVAVLPTIIQQLTTKGYTFSVYSEQHHRAVNFLKDESL